MHSGALRMYEYRITAVFGLGLRSPGLPETLEFVSGPLAGCPASLLARLNFSVGRDTALLRAFARTFFAKYRYRSTTRFSLLSEALPCGAALLFHVHFSLMHMPCWLHFSCSRLLCAFVGLECFLLPSHAVRLGFHSRVFA